METIEMKEKIKQKDKEIEKLNRLVQAGDKFLNAQESEIKKLKKQIEKCEEYCDYWQNKTFGCEEHLKQKDLEHRKKIEDEIEKLEKNCMCSSRQIANNLRTCRFCTAKKSLQKLKPRILSAHKKEIEKMKESTNADLEEKQVDFIIKEMNKKWRKKIEDSRFLQKSDTKKMCSKCDSDTLTQKTFDYPMITVEYCDKCGQVNGIWNIDGFWINEKALLGAGSSKSEEGSIGNDGTVSARKGGKTS